MGCRPFAYVIVQLRPWTLMSAPTKVVAKVEPLPLPPSTSTFTVVVRLPPGNVAVASDAYTLSTKSALLSYALKEQTQNGSKLPPPATPVEIDLSKLDTRGQ